MSNPLSPLATGPAAGSACTPAVTSRSSAPSLVLDGNQTSFYTNQHPLAIIDGKSGASTPTTWAQRAAAGLAGMRDRAAFHASTAVFASEFQDGISLGDVGSFVGWVGGVGLLTVIGIKAYYGIKDGSLASPSGV